MAAAAKQAGNDAFRAGRFEEAVKQYTAAIAAEPSEASLYTNRAAAYGALTPPLYDKALTDANTAVALNPNWPKGFFRKGLAHLKLQQYEEAITALTKCLDLTGRGDPDTLKLLAEARQCLKSSFGDKTTSSVKTAAEAKRHGNALFKESDYTGAAEYYSRAIEIAEAEAAGGATEEQATELAVYYINRAACHSQTHAYKSVAEDCTRAVTLDPRCVKGYLRRAIAYEGLEKWKLAADDYRKVLELAPGTANASSGLARCSKYAKDS